MTGIFEEVEAEWREHHHHHDAPQHPQAPATPHNGPQEAPMSLHAEIERDAQALAAGAQALAAKAQAVDHHALDALDAVLASPATAEAFAILGQLTHLPPAALATGLDVLRMVLATAGARAPAAAQDGPQPAPAGPVVGGQA